MKKILFVVTLLLSSLSVMAEQIDSLTPMADSASVKEESVGMTADDEGKEPSKIWDEANTAYINNNLPLAIKKYRTLTDQGLQSSKLFFNLGNAYFKNNELGLSILFYQKALRLSPANEDILYNLEIARSHTKDKIEQVPEFFIKRWNSAIRETMSSLGWTVTSLVVLCILLASLLAFLLSGEVRIRKIGFSGAIVCSFLFIISTSYALSERREMINNRNAVIMSSSIAVKSSPDNASTDLFVLHEGTTVHIMRTLGDWCEVVIADGKEGWIESRRIEKI